MPPDQPTDVARIIADLQHVAGRKQQADAVVGTYTEQLQQQLLERLAAGGTTGDPILDFVIRTYYGQPLLGLAQWLHCLQQYVQAHAGEPVVLTRSHWERFHFGGPHDHTPFERSHQQVTACYISVLAAGNLQLITSPHGGAEVGFPTLPRHVQLEHWDQPQEVAEPLPAIGLGTLLRWIKDQPGIGDLAALSDEEQSVLSLFGGSEFSLSRMRDETTTLTIGAATWDQWWSRTLYHWAFEPEHYFRCSRALGYALPLPPSAAFKARLTQAVAERQEAVERAQQQLTAAEATAAAARDALVVTQVEAADLAAYLQRFSPDEPDQ